MEILTADLVNLLRVVFPDAQTAPSLLVSRIKCRVIAIKPSPAGRAQSRRISLRAGLPQVAGTSIPHHRCRGD